MTGELTVVPVGADTVQIGLIASIRRAVEGSMYQGMAVAAEEQPLQFGQPRSKHAESDSEI